MVLLSWRNPYDPHRHRKRQHCHRSLPRLRLWCPQQCVCLLPQTVQPLPLHTRQQEQQRLSSWTTSTVNIRILNNYTLWNMASRLCLSMRLSWTHRSRKRQPMQQKFHLQHRASSEMWSIATLAAQTSVPRCAVCRIMRLLFLSEPKLWSMRGRRPGWNRGRAVRREASTLQLPCSSLIKYVLCIHCIHTASTVD